MTTAVRSQSVWISGEVLGVRLRPGAIPWNSEKVHVEASLRLPPSARVPADFRLEVEGADSVAAMRLQPGAEGRHHLHFCLGPLSGSRAASIFWRNHKLETLTIPVVARADYLASVTLRDPQIRIPFVPDGVIGTTFATKSKVPPILVATVVSPWPLLPLHSESLEVETRVGSAVEISRSPFAPNVLLGAEPLLMFPVPSSNRRASLGVVIRLDSRELYREEVHFVTPATIAESMVLVDMGFLIGRGADAIRTRRFPTDDSVEVAGWFRVRLRQRGAAWGAHALVSGSGENAADFPPFVRPVALSETVAEIVGGTMRAEHYRGLHGLELTIGGRSLGVLPLSRTPQAVLDSEGGFADPRAFDWDANAEAEFQARLGRLLG